MIGMQEWETNPEPIKKQVLGGVEKQYEEAFDDRYGAWRDRWRARRLQWWR
jgi:hypothetical protein